MKTLEIEQTYTTPKVTFDPQKNYFKLSGSSIPDNVDDFYSPLLSWLDVFLKDVNPSKIEFIFDIRYFNASSSKKIYRIVQKLQKYASNGGIVCVNWIYCKNDTSVYEVGQDISSMLQMEFNFIDTTDCCASHSSHSFSDN